MHFCVHLRYLRKKRKTIQILFFFLQNCICRYSSTSSVRFVFLLSCNIFYAGWFRSEFVFFTEFAINFAEAVHISAHAFMNLYFFLYYPMFIAFYFCFYAFHFDSHFSVIRRQWGRLVAALLLIYCFANFLYIFLFEIILFVLFSICNRVPKRRLWMWQKCEVICVLDWP